MSQTKIFVSSTCYDLIHMRQALNAHLLSLGHIPIMSEFANFDVNPDLSNVENCRANVRDNADVFVLIIGGRRGSIDPDFGKSVVNLEYEAAVEQGLDIYVFVDEAVLTLLPIWKRNKTYDFNPTVDSNDVLDFVERIRSTQRWTFPFTKENDIFEVLAQQMSIRFRTLLQKCHAGNLDHLELFKFETSVAKKLLLERGLGWEHLLTAELLESRLQKCRKDYADVQNERILGTHQYLNAEQYRAWVRAEFDELKAILQKLNFVVTKEIIVAWGPLGVPGKPLDILYSCNELHDALKAMVDIESTVFRTHGPISSEAMRVALLGMTEEIFNEFEPIPTKLRELIEKRRLDPSSQDGSFTLTFKFSRSEQIIAAFKQIENSK